MTEQPERVRRTMDGVRLDAIERTPVGGIRARAYLTRTGVLVYRNADGTERREWRDPDEVFAPESLATLRGVPVTLDHPPDLVRTDTWQAYAVGHVHDDVAADGPHVGSTITVDAARAVAEVESGRRREMSCGYECDLDWTGGTTPDGERFDARQVGIRYNHAALVTKGRAGSTVAIRLDSEGHEIMARRKDAEREKEDLEEKDDSEQEKDDSEEERDDAMTKLREENAELKADIVKLKADLKAEKSRGDAAAARADAVEASITERVASRCALLDRCRDHGVDVRADASDDDLRRGLLARILPSYDVTRRDSADLAVALDVALAASRDGVAAAARASVSSAAGYGRADSDDSALPRDVAAKRRALAEHNDSAPTINGIKRPA